MAWSLKIKELSQRRISWEIQEIQGKKESSTQSLTRP